MKKCPKYVVSPIKVTENIFQLVCLDGTIHSTSQITLHWLFYCIKKKCLIDVQARFKNVNKWQANTGRSVTTGTYVWNMSSCNRVCFWRTFFNFKKLYDLISFSIVVVNEIWITCSYSFHSIRLKVL